MSIKRIIMVARYEARLLRRSWVFLILQSWEWWEFPSFQFLIGSVDSAMEYGLTSDGICGI